MMAGQMLIIYQIIENLRALQTLILFHNIEKDNIMTKQEFIKYLNKKTLENLYLNEKNYDYGDLVSVLDPEYFNELHEEYEEKNPFIARCPCGKTPTRVYFEGLLTPDVVVILGNCCHKRGIIYDKIYNGLLSTSKEFDEFKKIILKEWNRVNGEDKTVSFKDGELIHETV